MLDEDGRFWHDGRPVEHPAMARAFARWIDRHPDDQRYILNNGYDWTYLTVLGAPLSVQAVTTSGRDIVLRLSNGCDELLRGDTLYLGPRDAVFANVKDGSWWARFTRDSQLALAPFVVESPGGDPELRVGGRVVRFEPLGGSSESRPGDAAVSGNAKKNSQ